MNEHAKIRGIEATSRNLTDAFRETGTPLVPQLRTSTRLQSAGSSSLLRQYLLSEALEYEQSKDWVSAELVFKEYIRISSGFIDQNAVEVALRLASKGIPDPKAQIAGYGTARDWFERNCQDATEGERAALILCHIQYREQIFGNGLADTESFLARYPKSSLLPDATLLKGNFLSQLDRSHEALSLFISLSGNPETPEAIAQKALFMAGWTHLFNGNQKSSQEAFRRVIERWPDSTLATKAKEILARSGTAPK